MHDILHEQYRLDFILLPGLPPLMYQNKGHHMFLKAMVTMGLWQGYSTGLGRGPQL